MPPKARKEQNERKSPPKGLIAKSVLEKETAAQRMVVSSIVRSEAAEISELPGGQKRAVLYALPQSMGYSQSSVQIDRSLGHVLIAVVDTAGDWARYIAAARVGESEAELRFRQLAAEWRAELSASSDLTVLVMHPAYQQIIGMGKQAIPFLLRELEQAPDHWFWALKAISGEDPVPQRSKGKLREMAAAWIEWGRRSGFI